MSETNINWFPGHMAKALNEIKASLKLCDVIIEIGDARAPISSFNPLLEDIISNKIYLKIFSKYDLCDLKKTKQVQDYYASKSITTLGLDLTKKESANEIIKFINTSCEPLKQKDIKRGLKPRNYRVMVVGIPNVGKSTLINLLAKRKSASVANKPGHTKAQQWIKCQGFDLLDTPGVLWPNVSKADIGIKLALIGSIKSEVLPMEDLSKYAFNFLNDNYPNYIKEKYAIEYQDYETFLDNLSLARKHLVKNNELDYQRTIINFLNDFKNGEIGKITLEEVTNG